MVVGLNYRTAPMAVRERFWISENRRYEALLQLSKAEGIEEVIVLATCNRTEFLLWVNDVTLAANSVMRLLGAEYGLMLCEWKHFYRLLDEAALLHIFRVASRLDSMVVGEPQVVLQMQQAWQQAQKVSATGRFLDVVMQKALAVSERVCSETAIGNAAVSIPYAAVALTRQIFGTLENKKVLLLGAGQMSELSARELLSHGADSVRVSVINRTLEHAVELATKLGGLAIPFEERWQHMAEADVIISSTSCPHTILSREEAELLIQERKVRGGKDRPLVIVDIAMPRNIDPAVRDVKGVFLYDLDDLENVSDHNSSEREAGANHRRAAPAPGRDLPARTGVLPPRVRAFLPGQGRNVECSPVADDAADRRVFGPRTQGTSRKGGAGADDHRSTTAVPPANAGTGACRHHLLRLATQLT